MSVELELNRKEQQDIVNPPVLTSCEQEVLLLIAEGLTTRRLQESYS